MQWKSALYYKYPTTIQTYMGVNLVISNEKLVMLFSLKLLSQLKTYA